MQSVHHSLFHIIISANGSNKFLTRVNQDILYNYLTGMLYNKLCEPIIINGHANHIHLVVQVSVDVSINKLVREVLQNSTDFLRRERSVFPEFKGWDSNFIAISYHPSQKESLKEKIKVQFDFHRKTSFEEELKELLT